MLQTVNELLRVGSANVSDAPRACGKHFQAMDGGIRPLSSSMRVAGPAFTVRCYPGGNLRRRESLGTCPARRCAGGGRRRIPGCHSHGGLMSTRCQERKIAGAILDSAVRMWKTSLRWASRCSRAISARGAARSRRLAKPRRSSAAAEPRCVRATGSPPTPAGSSSSRRKCLNKSLRKPSRSTPEKPASKVSCARQKPQRQRRGGGEWDEVVSSPDARVLCMSNAPIIEAFDSSLAASRGS